MHPTVGLMIPAYSLWLLKNSPVCLRENKHRVGEWHIGIIVKIILILVDSLKGSQRPRPQASVVHTLWTASLDFCGYPCIAEFCMSISEWAKIITSEKTNLEDQRTLLGGKMYFPLWNLWQHFKSIPTTVFLKKINSRFLQKKKSELKCKQRFVADRLI